MPDALQEFSVETSNYNANTARMRAAWSTSSPSTAPTNIMATRLNLSATGPSTPPTLSPSALSQGVDPLHRNQFGGTVGGPLEIPHLFQERQVVRVLWLPADHQSCSPRRPDPTRSFCRQSPRRARTRQAERRGQTTWYLPRCVSNPFDPNGTTYMVADAIVPQPIALRYFAHLEAGCHEPGNCEFPEAIVPALTANGSVAPFSTPEQFRPGGDHGARRPGDYAERQVD